MTLIGFSRQQRGGSTSSFNSSSAMRIYLWIATVICKTTRDDVQTQSYFFQCEPVAPDAAVVMDRVALLAMTFIVEYERAGSPRFPGPLARMTFTVDFVTARGRHPTRQTTYGSPRCTRDDTNHSIFRHCEEVESPNVAVHTAEEGQEGRNAYVEKRAPDFGKFVRYP